MNKLVKKVFIVLGSLLFLLLLVGNLISLNGKNKSDELLEKNKLLLKESTSLIEKVDGLQKDKLKLLEDLSKKEVEIVYKEKLIYKDKNVLIIPTDYNELKDNYTLLSSLYIEKTDMYNVLKKQSEEDYKTIEELKTKLEEVNDINEDLAYQIAHPKKEIFKQFLVTGFGYDASNQIKYHAGYQVVLFNKFTLEAIVQYPNPSASILFGIKI